ncbi:hypothetical protein [Bacteroides sp. 224]|uniref:hypothetical protein n=1 Tax=Bacteroides sp. 224 TaxID=2302936 RepID=UPI0013D021B3|nr:hypothetical protein [Bacteroides sp. 224]NDV63938.1 hypothetical protein [Bacteroides sp. 224]
MRKDIEIHINTGDIVINPHNTPKLRTFNWITNNGGLERYIYGEIQLPGNISEATIKENGVYISIPYTPKYKEFYVRIKRIFSDETSSFIQNPVDGSDWFLARSGLCGGDMKNIYASQLLLISENVFYIRLNKGYANIYSGNESDVNIVPAKRQNANLMLKCLPTNNYRYPLTGVGLIRWVNSNIHYTELSAVLQREFGDDGMNVKNAAFDLESKDLQLELEHYNND